MKSNEVLQKEVIEAIKFEPMLDATEIGVIVKDAIVTLTGTVDSLNKKTEALHAAKKVKGVAAIVDEINVVLAKSSVITDQEIALQIVSKLKENQTLPKNAISIMVEKGSVTAEGVLPWNFQREIALDLIKNQSGVREVYNNIQIKKEIEDKVEKDLIVQAFCRHWALDPDEIEIRVSGSTVELSGFVGSIFQKEEAERIAYKTQGVSKVVNRLKVDLELPYLC